MSRNTQSFKDVLDAMRAHGMKAPGERLIVRIPNARKELHDVMREIVEGEGRRFVWLPEYEKVAEWLADNQGKGIMLQGNCGRGKSLIGRYAIPALLLKHINKITHVYDIQEMNQNIDDILKKRLVSIDDAGTEYESVKFGERRTAFAEIIDSAEKTGQLVIFSTNLIVQNSQSGNKTLRDLYGVRIVDRLRSIIHHVAFVGDSMRGKN